MHAMHTPCAGICPPTTRCDSLVAVDRLSLPGPSPPRLSLSQLCPCTGFKRGASLVYAVPSAVISVQCIAPHRRHAPLSLHACCQPFATARHAARNQIRPAGAARLRATRPVRLVMLTFGRRDRPLDHPARTMSQQFELDFDFGSPEPEPAAASPPPPPPPAASGSPSPAPSPSPSAAEALNGMPRPRPAPVAVEEDDNVPDEDELLAMMEQDARENMARDVENLAAMRRTDGDGKAAAAAAAARRRAAILAALGAEPLQDITNAPAPATPAHTQTQSQTQTQPAQDTQREPARIAGESSMFEADFDFGEPAAASCECSPGLPPPLPCCVSQLSGIGPPAPGVPGIQLTPASRVELTPPRDVQPIKHVYDELGRLLPPLAAETADGRTVIFERRMRPNTGDITVS